MEESTEINKTVNDEQNVEESKIKHIFIRSPIVLLEDFFLRIILFVLINYGLVREWFFWVSQLILIPVLIISTLVWIGEKGRIERRTRKKFNLDKSELIEYEGTGWFILLAIGIILITTILVYLRYPQWHIALRIVVAVVFFALYSVFIFLIGVLSGGTKPKDKKLYQKQISNVLPTENIKQNDFIKELSKVDFRNVDARSNLLLNEKNFSLIQNLIDNNDIEIVEMQSEVDSATQRVDTYTLESALLGGLAFSGFLSLLSSEKPVISITQELISNLSQVFANPPVEWLSGLTSTFNGNSLLSFILIETLVCSMLFLSVIVARIRFNDTIKNTDFTVRSAKAYNDKEEEVFLSLMESDTHNVTYLTERLLLLNKDTKEIISSSIPLFDQIFSIINYMRVFRSLGLACFVLILATAALFVSKALSIFFIALYILSYAYMSIDKFARSKKINQQITLRKSAFKKK